MTHHVMRVLLAGFALCVCAMSAPATAGGGGADTVAPINDAIGDASWIALHGHRPSGKAGEVDRIRTHLLYVIGKLSSAETSDLTDAQRDKRQKALDGLRQYAAAGVFPRRAANDGYGERRPRFIDDRGVHCAVGEIMRRSGHGELARVIDEHFEYAYVPEIPHRLLGEWARTHGFSTRELAMIQPQYGSPPSKRQIRARIERMTEELTLTCAAKHDVPESVIVKVRRSRGGRSKVATGFWPSDFARCVRDELQNAGFGEGGAWSSPPTAFRLRMKLEVTPPGEIAKQRLSRMEFGGPSAVCLPLPGPVPEKVSVRLRSTRAGFDVDVASEPINEEVERCFEEEVRDTFLEYTEGGHWEFAHDRVMARKPLLTEARLSNPIIGAGHQCVEKADRESYTAHIESSVEAQSFRVEIEGANPGFATCMEEAYNDVAASDFSVSRRRPHGKYERYFRIIDRAKASIDFGIGVADPSVCPDGGSEVTLEKSSGRRCHGQMRGPEPNLRRR
jgi:hypothetical protein